MCQPVTERFFFLLFFRQDCFRCIFLDIWVSGDPNFPSTIFFFGNGLAGAHRTRVQTIKIYLKKTAWKIGLVCGKRV